MNPDEYFNRKEVSNSDLGNLQKLLMPREQVGNIEAAYRFGTLVDAIITEPERVDYFNFMVDDVQYTKEEFDIAEKMKLSFKKDPFCSQLLPIASYQKVMSRSVDIEYQGFPFSLPMRCKWDLWMEMLIHGGDIKSTTATTLQQFLAAIEYFNYDRQRVVYMDISGAKKDLLIGISKVNFKVFIVPIDHNSEIYKRGKEKFQYLAFKYWSLFHDFFNENAVINNNQLTF